MQDNYKTQDIQFLLEEAADNAIKELSKKQIASGAIASIASKRFKPAQRRAQILDALLEILKSPDVDKISIAVVAKKAGISEAIIYRVFINKNAMFLGLIEIIEQHVFTNINRIEIEYENGLDLVNSIVEMLLDFAQNNAGMTRVLTNEALFCEDKSLHLRMQQLVDRVEASLRQAYRIAAAQDMLPKGQEIARANLMLCYVMGCWQRFSRSGFQKSPKDMWDIQKSIAISNS
jgi:TetR/AcrR family transcriptional regulator